MIFLFEMNYLKKEVFVIISTAIQCVLKISQEVYQEKIINGRSFE